jgi:hypothetical protein
MRSNGIRGRHRRPDGAQDVHIGERLAQDGNRTLQITGPLSFVISYQPLLEKAAARLCHLDNLVPNRKLNQIAVGP